MPSIIRLLEPMAAIPSGPVADRDPEGEGTDG